jgi:predicted RNase H-like HicB family nuclease
MKDRYSFPALFANEEGQVTVTFPDLPGCVTSGDGFDHALAMAEEAMGGHILSMCEAGEAVPAPTPAEKLTLEPGEYIVMVSQWMPLVIERAKPVFVRKNLTIPRWLNIKAEEAHINFSGVLQEALREKLGM